MSKKKGEDKKLKQQMGITADRGPTFVGLRPTVYKDKSKYNRKRDKREMRRSLYE